MCTSQPSRIHCGAVALVGDAHLEARVAQQASHDGGADRAGAARHEDALHGSWTLPLVTGDSSAT